MLLTTAKSKNTVTIRHAQGRFLYRKLICDTELSPAHKRLNNMIYETKNRNETFELGNKLSEAVSPGDIYCLSGDLGAGKTAFAQGFAEGLGVKEDVTSPTFTILCVYEGGRLPFYHFDVYRFEDSFELEDIGGDEYLYGDGVCLIEWPEKIKDHLPENTKNVVITKDIAKGEDFRRIETDF